MRINIQREEGYLPNKYSKQAEESHKYKENPIISFPISLSEVPEGTKSIALTLIDYDAVPVCGFPWIHWTACNIPGGIKEIPEDISRNDGFGIVQGKNSFSSPFIGETDPKIINRYTGPTPPDRDHNYTLVVYALDILPNLEDGFYLNELYKKIEGHVLGNATEIILAKC